MESNKRSKLISGAGNEIFILGQSLTNDARSELSTAFASSGLNPTRRPLILVNLQCRLSMPGMFSRDTPKFGVPDLARGTRDANCYGSKDVLIAAAIRPMTSAAIPISSCYRRFVTLRFNSGLKPCVRGYMRVRLAIGNPRRLVTRRSFVTFVVLGHSRLYTRPATAPTTCWFRRAEELTAGCTMLYQASCL